MNLQSPAQDFGERVITLNRAHVNNFGGRRARVGRVGDWVPKTQAYKRGEWARKGPGMP